MIGDDIMGAFLTIIVSSLLTGIVTAIGTVAAIRVHISYLRESLAKAFRRIEGLEARVMDQRDNIDRRGH